MINDWLTSLRGNIVRRTTNPFLGTLFVVWIIRNWDFVYSLIYFDSSYTLESRLEYIRFYFQDYGIMDGFYTILITFVVIIVTYTLLNLSMLIANFSDKKVKPYVLKLTDSKSIVELDKYLALQKRVEDLRQKVDEEREQKLKYRGEVEDLENRIVEITRKTNYALPPDENEDDRKNNIQEPQSDLSENEIVRMLARLTRRNLTTEFVEVAGKILNGESIMKDEARNFAKLELITPDYNKESNISGHQHYKLTELGEAVNRHTHRGNSGEIDYKNA